MAFAGRSQGGLNLAVEKPGGFGGLAGGGEIGASGQVGETTSHWGGFGGEIGRHLANLESYW